MGRWQRRIFGILALGGSFLGVTVGFERLIGSSPLSTKILISPFIALYVWGIWCGIALIEALPGALRVNRFFWALQIPVIVSPIVGYMFASGALLNLSVDSASMAFHFYTRLGSQVGISFLNAGQPWGIGINIVALGAFMYLNGCVRRQGVGLNKTD